MSDSPVQQIKDKLDIVEVVSSYIKLEKTGINLRACCPFHSEKKPSFFVSPSRQMFKCFGCSVGGDMFEFIMKIEGIEFGDALRLLARRAGVALKTFHPELQTKRQRLYEICELGCRFFEKQLGAGSRGKQVKDYLLSRGLTEESIKKWRLGYSPDTWQGLSDFLIGKGYKRDEIIEAGLAVKKESSGHGDSYDRFRGRIMFPVFDLNSQVVGFGGRITKAQEAEEIAKYINTPSTLLYDKSRVLYGLNFGKVEIRRKDSCILAEGYTDVILSHQAGFANTVASSGTSLTPEQLKILKRYTANLLTAFDMDTAGDLATKRGIGLAQNQGFEVKVISMPVDSDPADIITKAPEKWKELVEGAQEIMTFYFENTCAKFDKESALGKKEIARVLLPAIKKIPNKILQSHWLQKLAGLLRTSEETIFEELKKLTGKESKPAVSLPIAVEKKEKQRQELLEEAILSLVLQSPVSIKFIDDVFLSYCASGIRDILKIVRKENVDEKGNTQEALHRVKQERNDLKPLIDNCIFMSEAEQHDKPEEEIKVCLASWSKLFKQKQLRMLSNEIKNVEEQGDAKKLKKLMEQFNQLCLKS